jgi:hypothetical protein
MIALFQSEGGAIFFICGIYLFLIFLLILGLGALAKYLAERNAKNWEQRLMEGNREQSTDDA